MKLLVDSGATKANWALTQGGQILRKTQSSGISPYFLDDASIAALVNQVRQELPSLAPREVFFYSTGCNAIEQKQRMERLFRELFPEAERIQVQTDLLGAARAACQTVPGIVGILGTGSNACRYDGNEVAETAGGLGFILGDEGSGAAIGKELIVALLNRELDPVLAAQLQDEYLLSRDHILQSVYQLPFPNRYLASFTPFVYKHREEELLSAILNRQFGLFFRRNVVPLSKNQGLSVHFIGSVAHYFRAEIEQAAQEFDLVLGHFEQDPMPGLARYHA